MAKLFESRRDEEMDRPICRVMSPDPTAIPSGAMLNRAIEIFAQKKISELPVVDDQHRPCGLIDITDVVEMLPRPESAESDSAQSERSGSAAAACHVVLPFPNQQGTVPVYIQWYVGEIVASGLVIYLNRKRKYLLSSVILLITTNMLAFLFASLEDSQGGAFLI